MRRVDDFGRERQNLRAGQNHAVKLQLQPSLAHEVAGSFGVFQMAAQLRAARKHRMAKGSDRAEMA